MTYTTLKAKPGEYVWDEEAIQFVGRINIDGTEDKRFSKGGLCSLLNTILEETGYLPKEPQQFARTIANHKQTHYLVKGYGVIVKCYDLSAEMWVATAADGLGIEGDGIADILKHVSKSKEIEHKSKIKTLALIFGKELKSKKLADLTVVSEFEHRLKNERRELAAKEKKEQKERELHSGVIRIADLICEWVVYNNPKKIEEAIYLSGKYSELWVMRAIILGHKRLPKDVAKQVNKEIGKPFFRLLEENKCSLAKYIAECARLKYEQEKYAEEIINYPEEIDLIKSFK